MLYIVYPLLCLLHLVVVNVWPEVFLLRLGSKVLPILLLLWDFTRDRRWQTRATGIWIGFGLVFSFFGDAILTFPAEYFVFGLGSFLIAQLSYSWGFSRGNPVQIVRLIPFVIVGGGFYYWLLPGIPIAMSLPVLLYVAAICTMGWRASSRECEKSDLWLGISGAVIFIFSDMLIALSHFTSIRFPAHGSWIMGTYYLAQFLIFVSTEEES
ncbi:lysoplasmalogenase [Leptospira broomii]|uniref:lysoplasmalogenase n=1 Tax=Leptospira broomii TaxID=301541 RepID=UPI00028A364C|nr:lysoplasmalogenase [Leptospira broomii]